MAVHRNLKRNTNRHGYKHSLVCEPTSKGTLLSKLAMYMKLATGEFWLSLELHSLETNKPMLPRLDKLFLLPQRRPVHSNHSVRLEL